MIDASGPDTETLAEHQLPNYQTATDRDHLQERSDSELGPIRKRLQHSPVLRVTFEQKAAINDYVTSPEINAKLRATNGIDTLTVAEEMQFVAIEEAIDSAGRRSEPTTMWRGIARQFRVATLRQIETCLESGVPFRERGIQSYSIQPSAAAVIADQGGLVLELESRRGIYISDLAGNTEEEVLQSSNASFVVSELLRDVMVTLDNGEKIKVTVARLKEPIYGSK